MNFEISSGEAHLPPSVLLSHFSTAKNQLIFTFSPLYGFFGNYLIWSILDVSMQSCWDSFKICGPFSFVHLNTSVFLVFGYFYLKIRLLFASTEKPASSPLYSFNLRCFWTSGSEKSYSWLYSKAIVSSVRIGSPDGVMLNSLI